MNDIIINNYWFFSYSAYLLLFIFLIFMGLRYCFSKNIQTYKVSKFSFSDICFIFSVFVFLLIQRYFTFFSHKTNIDESFHLAIASKLASGDHLWSDIDPGSVGPVNTLLFVLVSMFTGDFSFFTAKCTTLFVIFISFVFLYLSFIRLMPRAISCLLVSCFIVCMCVPDGSLTISYNSEMILLPMLSFWLFSFVKSHKHSKYWFFLQFFVIGLMPFGKLQFAPVAVLLFIVSFVSFIRKNFNELNFISVTKNLTLFSFISSLPLFLILLDGLVNNSLIWFVRFYFLNMISYMETGNESVNSSYHVMFQNFVGFWSDIFYLYYFTLFNLVLVVISLFKKKRLTAYFCISFLGLSIYEVLKPLFGFYHYTNIMLIPLFSCVALLLFVLRNKLVNVCTVIICLIFVFCHFIKFDSDYELKLSYVNNHGFDPGWFEIANDLRSTGDKSDRLVVWGWMSELYVVSEHAPGTAEIGIGNFVPSKFINRVFPEYTKQKFIDDLINNKPRFIIDTPSVITSIYDDPKYSIHNYPEIWNIVKNDYHVNKYYKFGSSPTACDDVSNNISEHDFCVRIPLYEHNKY